MSINEIVVNSIWDSSDIVHKGRFYTEETDDTITIKDSKDELTIVFDILYHTLQNRSILDILIDKKQQKENNQSWYKM